MPNKAVPFPRRLQNFHIDGLVQEKCTHDNYAAYNKWRAFPNRNVPLFKSCCNESVLRIRLS